MVDFNDIFEVAPRYDLLIQAQIDHLTKREFAFQHELDWYEWKVAMRPINEQLARESTSLLPERLQAEFGEHFGILCFTEKLSNLLMWGHYTANHEGFVVEFDTSHNLFAPENFQAVTYSEVRPVVDTNVPWSILLTKSPEWDYEKEHRLVLPLHMAKSGRRSEKDLKDRGFVDLPIESVRAVYYGSRIKEKTFHQLTSALAVSDCSHIQRFMMERASSTFTLKSVPLAEWKPPSEEARTDFEQLLVASLERWPKR